MEFFNLMKVVLFPKAMNQCGKDSNSIDNTSFTHKLKSLRPPYLTMFTKSIKIKHTHNQCLTAYLVICYLKIIKESVV